MKLPVRLVGALLIVGGLALPMLPLASANHNDGGSGGDAGNSFAAATAVSPLGPYSGTLAGGGDNNDYYKFGVALGAPINIEIRVPTGCMQTGSLQTNDAFRRIGFRLLDPNGVVLDTPNTNVGDSRVMISAAPVAGDYRFLVTNQPLGGCTPVDYTFCFLTVAPPHPCPPLQDVPIEIIWGGSNGDSTPRVLLVPPAHGDLGNPFGPTALDYLNAVLSGIHEWNRVLDEFATDYPAYSYLSGVEATVEIFDGLQNPDLYDIVIVFIETAGSQFRGVASPCVDEPRCVVLTMFAQSPRAGQTLPDYPEYNDLEAVVKHEFAHVYGLGHTARWDTTFGPDLMNSPAPFVYGDGNPVGDGGERTAKKCVSTLDLYGMAVIFGGGTLPQWVSLPAGIPYAWYC